LSTGYVLVSLGKSSSEGIIQQLNIQEVPRVCCISVEAMPDEAFNHFSPEKVQGFCIDGFNFLALSWEIPE